MKTHPFETTGSAYDACQCDDEIANGDLLDIESEGVVGLAGTWPVAVTAEKGELHGMTANPGGVERVMADSGWTEDHVRAAVSLASERGYEIAEPFRGYLPSAPTP